MEGQDRLRYKKIRWFESPSFDRRSLRIDPDDKLILAVGRYHLKKGYEDLLKAVRIVAQDYNKFKLLIVGRELQKLNPLVESLDIGEFVRFVDEQVGENDCFQFPNN